MIGRTNAVIAKSGGKWPSADDVQVTYTGDMADPREITDAAGNKYVLYELTSSGTLTVDKPVPVDVCVVAGGGNGQRTTSQQWGSYGNYGGAGGSMKNDLVILTGSMNCMVGAAARDVGGSSKIEFQEYSMTAIGVGTGGGRGSGGDVSNGDGKEKYVFGDNSVYNYPICAGGGSGAQISYVNYDDPVYRVTTVGANGGTNGGDGSNDDTVDYLVRQFPNASMPYLPWPSVGGQGGEHGGGNGAFYTATTESAADVVDATDAYTYGSGGGGAILVDNSNRFSALGNAGAGYQGVIFIRILK